MQDRPGTIFSVKDNVQEDNRSFVLKVAPHGMITHMIHSLAQQPACASCPATDTMPRGPVHAFIPGIRTPTAHARPLVSSMEIGRTPR